MLRDFCLKITVAVMLMAMALMDGAREALAASTNIGGAAEGLANQMAQIKTLAMMVSLVLGIILVIMGIIKLTKRSGGEDGGIAKGLIFIIAGVLMVGIPALVMMGNASIGFDDAGSGAGQLQYGTGTGK